MQQAHPDTHTIRHINSESADSASAAPADGATTPLEPLSETVAGVAPAPAPATPMMEPGFVIATTDDSSPPPVTEGQTFHHIKNFAGTEQTMTNGEVAAQGAGADFQEGEVCLSLSIYIYICGLEYGFKCSQAYDICFQKGL
jgi:hypothetical protein